MGTAKWQPIESAPKDGSFILLLIHHPNRKYAKPDERPEWEATVKARWIDFNGGGWTWNGMAGAPKFWISLE